MYWHEYMVGPLPATNATIIERLTYPFHNSQPGQTAVHPVYVPNDGTNLLFKFGAEVEDISIALFNAVSPSNIVEGGIAAKSVADVS
jgi:primary-amine oxidase